MAQNSTILIPASLCLSLILTSCAPHHKLSPRLLTQLGDSAAESSNSHEAETLYQRALHTQPQNQTTRLKLLRLYLDDKNYAAILKESQRLKLDKTTLDLFRIRGIAFDLTGQHDKAQQVYAHILARFPEDEKTHMNLMLSLKLGGQHEEATRHHEKCSSSLSPHFQEQLDSHITNIPLPK